MRMHIYKPGQGGCWRLYEKLDASYENLWVVTMVPVGVFVAFGVAIFWLLNKASLANFLIAAEGELKKVNWSSRKEVAVSTVVVIIVVVGMAVLLGTTDLIFQLVFTQLLG